MGRKTLNDDVKKIKFSISMNQEIFNKINKLETNKSKYLEWLVYNDLKNKNIIKTMML